MDAFAERFIMLKSRLIHLSAFALVASAATALHTPLLAQGSTMRLAFGYQCGDDFVVHNDGSQPVDLQYAVAGSPDQASLHLGGGQSLTITSPANAPLQLLVGGKVVASEPKGSRACAPTAGGANVIVRPLNPGDGSSAQPPMAADGSAAPLNDAPPAYDYYPPYPYPYYYPYPCAYYGGYYPYLYGGPLVSIRAGGVFGGFPRGGGVIRGRGGRIR
jgi:hypothetical protein